MVCLVFIQDFGICCHWAFRHLRAGCHRAPFHPPHTLTHAHTRSDPYRCFELLARWSGPLSRKGHWSVHETCKSACVCVPVGWRWKRGRVSSPGRTLLLQTGSHWRGRYGGFLLRWIEGLTYKHTLTHTTSTLLGHREKPTCSGNIKWLS